MASIKDLKKEHFLNPAFFGELFFFIIGYLIVLLCVSRLILRDLPVVEVVEYNPISFLGYFFVLTFFVYITLKRFSWSGRFIKVLFYLALIQGVFFVTSIYFNDLLFSILSLLIIFAAYLFIHNIFIHNLVLIVALSGISLILSSKMSFQTAMIISVILAIYDWIAVNKTKHMVTMFKNMVNKNVFFALIIPYRIVDYKHSIRLVEINQRYVFLGTGDIVVPLMIFIPSLLVDLSLAWNVFFGSFLGLIVLYIQFLLRDERKALPGLPPIVTGALIGYLLWLW